VAVAVVGRWVTQRCQVKAGGLCVVCCVWAFALLADLYLNIKYYIVVFGPPPEGGREIFVCAVCYLLFVRS
jgi:hypothetical protein